MSDDFHTEADDGTPYDIVFDEILGSTAKESTLHFVESLVESYEQNGHLTPKQHEKLMDIWEEAHDKLYENHMNGKDD
jgi:hypothetical protein